MKKSLLGLFVLVVTASAANAQALSNTSLTKVAMGGATYLKAAGLAQKEQNVTVAYIKLQIGTLTNGVFAPAANPTIEKEITPAFVNNESNYDHTFTTAFTPGTYTVKVQMYKTNFFGVKVAYGAHSYGTVTVP